MIETMCMKYNPKISIVTMLIGEIRKIVVMNYGIKDNEKTKQKKILVPLKYRSCQMYVQSMGKNAFFRCITYSTM